MQDSRDDRRQTRLFCHNLAYNRSRRHQKSPPKHCERPLLMPDLITTCEAAARAGGRVLLDWRKRFTVREKGPADLVTEADLASQEAIRQLVNAAFPEHAFLGEESPAEVRQAALDDTTPNNTSPNAPSSNTPQWTWVVDPLDGTTNYVHGLAQYAVSVAVLHRGVPEAGCVFDPVANECFTAVRGQGAFLNGEPIAASGQTDLAQSLVAVSFPARIDRQSREIQDFLAMLPHCQAFRRMGSAALNLCYVAAGSLDAYWATSTKIWDIAAGALIVAEAGGTITALDGAPLDVKTGKFIAAATRPLVDRLVELLDYTAK
jgi:myo-inositol-1(or 4)-monophosphatase